MIIVTVHYLIFFKEFLKILNLQQNNRIFFIYIIL